MPVEEAYPRLEQRAGDLEERARTLRKQYSLGTVHEQADKLDARARVLREVAGHVLAIDWFSKFFKEVDAAPQALRRELSRRAPRRGDIFFMTRRLDTGRLKTWSNSWNEQRTCNGAHTSTNY